MVEINSVPTVAQNGMQIPLSVRQRMLADQLLQEQVAQPTPIIHPWAGIAKLAAGALGGYMSGQEARQFEEGAANARSQMQIPIPGGGGLGGSPAPGANPAAGASNAQGESAPSSVAGSVFYNGYLARGFNPAQAAALTGNTQQESSFNPNAYNAKEGAVGSLQWRAERAQALQQFAASEGKPVNDPNVQMDFTLHEMHGSEAKNSAAFLAATDIPSANAALKSYIRYGDDSQGTRLKNALAYTNGQGPPGTPAQPVRTASASPLGIMGTANQPLSDDQIGALSNNPAPLNVNPNAMPGPTSQNIVDRRGDPNAADWAPQGYGDGSLGPPGQNQNYLADPTPANDMARNQALDAINAKMGGTGPAWRAPAPGASPNGPQGGVGLNLLDNGGAPPNAPGPRSGNVTSVGDRYPLDYTPGAPNPQAMAAQMAPVSQAIGNAVGAPTPGPIPNASPNDLAQAGAIPNATPGPLPIQNAGGDAPPVPSPSPSPGPSPEVDTSNIDHLDPDLQMMVSTGQMPSISPDSMDAAKNAPPPPPADLPTSNSDGQLAAALAAARSVPVDGDNLTPPAPPSGRAALLAQGLAGPQAPLAGDFGAMGGGNAPVPPPASPLAQALAQPSPNAPLPLPPDVSPSAVSSLAAGPAPAAAPAPPMPPPPPPGAAAPPPYAVSGPQGMPFPQQAPPSGAAPPQVGMGPSAVPSPDVPLPPVRPANLGAPPANLPAPNAANAGPARVMPAPTPPPQMLAAALAQPTPMMNGRVNNSVQTPTQFNLAQAAVNPRASLLAAALNGQGPPPPAPMPSPSPIGNAPMAGGGAPAPAPMQPQGGSAPTVIPAPPGVPNAAPAPQQNSTAAYNPYANVPPENLARWNWMLDPKNPNSRYNTDATIQQAKAMLIDPYMPHAVPDNSVMYNPGAPAGQQFTTMPVPHKYVDGIDQATGQPATGGNIPAGVNPKTWQEEAAKRAQIATNPTPAELTPVTAAIKELPSYKEYTQAVPTYNALPKMMADNSEASVKGLVDAFGKILNPGRAVTTGSMQIIMDTQSIPDTLKGEISKAISGQSVLSDNTKMQMAAIMRDKMEQYRNAWQGAPQVDPTTGKESYPTDPKTGEAIYGGDRGQQAKNIQSYGSGWHPGNVIPSVPDMVSIDTHTPVNTSQTKVAPSGIPTLGPNDQATYMRMPSGTQYRAPDGSVRTKP